jgi:hypothetical protein
VYDNNNVKNDDTDGHSNDEYLFNEMLWKHFVIPTPSMLEPLCFLCFGYICISCTFLLYIAFTLAAGNVTRRGRKVSCFMEPLQPFWGKGGGVQDGGVFITDQSPLKHASIRGSIQHPDVSIAVHVHSDGFSFKESPSNAVYNVTQGHNPILQIRNRIRIRLMKIFQHLLHFLLDKVVSHSPR